VEKTEVLTRGGAEPEEEIRGGGGCSPPAARFLSPFSLSGRRRRATNRGEKRKKGQEALLLLRSIGLGPAPARTVEGRSRGFGWMEKLGLSGMRFFIMYTLCINY
jgi:hypothetical protein